MVSRDRHERWQPPAAVGGGLRIAVIACWLAFVLFTILTGDWPVNY